MNIPKSSIFSNNYLFKVGGTIYPVAIKYDPLFGDAFWNSSKVIIIPFQETFDCFTKNRLSSKIMYDCLCILARNGYVYLSHDDIMGYSL